MKTVLALILGLSAQVKPTAPPTAAPQYFLPDTPVATVDVIDARNVNPGMVGVGGMYPPMWKCPDGYKMLPKDVKQGPGAPPKCMKIAWVTN